MRISVDINDDLLKEVIALTGEKNKSPALAKAVMEFVRYQKVKRLGRLIREGVFHYPNPQETPDEVEESPAPLW